MGKGKQLRYRGFAFPSQAISGFGWMREELEVPAAPGASSCRQLLPVQESEQQET